MQQHNSHTHRKTSISIATYNIHRCIGRDGVYSPERIRSVLQEIDADILALQEVEQLYENPALLLYLCDQNDWQAIPGITMRYDEGHYGNALLTRLPVDSIQQIDLSVPRREPRAAISTKLRHDNKQIHVVATHLGLRPGERRQQVKHLLQEIALDEEINGQSDYRILLGDLNEWFLWGRPLRWLRRVFQSTPAPRTYPVRFPLFSLDRIWLQPRSELIEIKTWRSETARVASDHLPLVARFNVA